MKKAFEYDEYEVINTDIKQVSLGHKRIIYSLYKVDNQKKILQGKILVDEEGSEVYRYSLFFDNNQILYSEFSFDRIHTWFQTYFFPSEPEYYVPDRCKAIASLTKVSGKLGFIIYSNILVKLGFGMRNGIIDAFDVGIMVNDTWPRQTSLDLDLFQNIDYDAVKITGRMKDDYWGQVMNHGDVNSGERTDAAVCSDFEKTDAPSAEKDLYVMKYSFQKDIPIELRAIIILSTNPSLFPAIPVADNFFRRHLW